MQKGYKNTLATLLIAGLCWTPSQAATLTEINGTKVTMKGYVKFDALVSNYSDGELSAGNLGRDFYLPPLIPVGGESSSAVTDFHARQSRISFGTSTQLDEDTVETYFEFDFLVTPDGNERVSNSYEPRMRHAYLKYNNWLLGQTWTTFMNVGALPDSLDFIGNADATIFVRQAQVRYSAGPWQFALENPETTVTPFGGGGRIVTDDNLAPDAVVRYNYKHGKLSLVTAALLRQLSYDDGNGIDDTEVSFGLSISGRYQFTSDDIRFVLNSGRGLGRYIGLNLANGAVLDAGGDLEAIDSTGYAIAYRHFWNSQWRSSFIYSAIDIDNDTDLTGTGVSESTQSTRLNLIYSPTPRLSVGAELSYASRDLESGADGDMNRLQLSAKLTF
ncbi:porin [Exilibacterium tricleocarpae]|uniref:Porin n=1 Tax=Exilibacterium tricleocarpae TaxID=2591008 RepID=A0A545U855_9GAMM|nr:DcaP family trimeric outer membrane transporter [Exilibacterium tricleocarpae]TQV85660.1 porin [Exilibacterium tricleocarpae]